MSCDCSADWRVEILNLATGARRMYVKPLSLSFEEKLNEVGSGTMTLSIHDALMVNIWPHITSVMVTRIAGPGATPSSPVGVWCGLVEEVSADSGGEVSIGMVSLEGYLAYRILPKYSVEDRSQTLIAADFVRAPNSIPLKADPRSSSVKRTRNYDRNDYKVRLEALLQLTEVINGPDYRLTHTFSNGTWSTTVVIQDRVGNPVSQPLNVRRGITTYSLNVSATDHRTNQFGSGESIHSSASDNSGMYPVFEISNQWSDVSKQNTLDEHTRGALQNNKHPRAQPSLQIADLNMALHYNIGDTLNINMNHGVVQFVGDTRLVSKAWSIAEGQPTYCQFGFIPDTDPATSVLNVPPSNREGCC